MKLSCVLGAALLLALARPGWAADTLSLPAVADTYADASAPTTRFGTNSRFRVDGSPTSIAYLRFVVSGTADQTVTAARLRLQASTGSGASAGRIHRINDNAWDESTLTWNTRPAIDGPVLYTLGPVASGAIAEFILDGAIAGDGTYSFAIDATSGDGLAYYSLNSTGGQLPTLVLTLEPRGTAVTILAPADGETVIAGEPVVLGASATGDVGEDLSAAIAWTSSLDGPLGTGAELVVSDLTVGVHVLTAAVTDAAGTTVMDEVSIAVTDSPPVPAMLTFPAIADTYVDAGIPGTAFGTATLLKADASPTRQAFLRFRVTGTLGAPVHTARLRLTVGPSGNDESVNGGRIHAISNHDWTEAGTRWASRPTVDGPVLSTLGTAAANAVLEFDVTDAIAGDGVYDFALDTTSTDGVGYRSREATAGAPALVLSFVPGGGANELPMVAIATPPNGITVGQGTRLTFFGGAFDTEDGDLSASLQWRSSRDGVLGTGEEVSAVLSLGTHTITAIATDGALGMGSASIVVTVGTFVAVEGPAFGGSVATKLNPATAEKPESKLWYHDGSWWGTLYKPAAGAHRIHRLDMATQKWIDTGAIVDPRPMSRQDTLSVGDTLYIVSRHAESPRQNKMMRYSYTHAGGYVLDPGFPVNIAGAGSETLTIARDSTGTLWIVFIRGREVRLSHTLGSDTVWSTPFAVPVPDGVTVGHDDISTIVTLPSAIGVFWNNHVTDKFHFAVHPDGLPPNDPASWTQETAYSRRNGADDHMNLKVSNDGHVFAAVKSDSFSPTTTETGLLVRSPDRTWSPLHQVAVGALDATRPLVMIDEDLRLVYVFYAKGSQAIYYKASPMDAISFPPGDGIPFIRSSKSGGINNPTSTKQSIGFSTGLVVLASTTSGNRYWHNAFPPEP